MSQELNVVYQQRGQGREALVFLPHLRAWREAAGLTLWRLAAACHMSAETISRLERQLRPAHFGTVGRLAEVLGIDNRTLIRCEPPAEKLPNHWAFGVTVRVTEEQCGELRFRMPFLHVDLAHRGLRIADLATQTGIDTDELEAIYENRQGATLEQLQRIAAALESPVLSLIRC
jgi:transcriptional regulator with XRE-family HTH domain